MPEVALKNILAAHTKEGTLCLTMPHNWVQCVACGHRCKIPPGKDGICKIRFNEKGTLLVPHGYVSGIAVDPMEKKPFFHAYPGRSTLSFGMLGCDYHCPFCQNWVTSQTLRDVHAVSSIQDISADEIVHHAVEHSIPIITSTYNEPLITSEWAVEVFKVARKAGLITSFVSNGNATPEVLDFLQPWIDLYKVDLKSFRQKAYAQMGGVLQNVLDTILSLHQRGIWVEVVTLVVPGLNDSNDELTDIARFLVSVSADIPWHVTAYHQEYKMTGEETTPVSTLMRAAEIGYREGLHFVYTGNRPGQTRNYEHTYCYSCHELLIERRGFQVRQNRISHGTCPRCNTAIAGRWS
jgi:pyruvate formate lyase activating enzyme